jgi:very-short-patch-repair endonuclease
MTFTRQKHVGRYYVDLYIPEINLCVECDEFDHREYDSIKERYRQKWIEHALKGKFLRFNPNKEGFDIANVVNEILQMYLEVSRSS